MKRMQPSQEAQGFSPGLSSLLIATAGIWLFYRWHQNRAAARITSRSDIIQTRLGPVEYAWRGDQGPVTVIVHGLPGGFDQGMAIAGWLSAAPCRFLCISRPGYLRTPISCGRTPDEQADLIAAVLDAMKIESASVLGMSAGGPSATRFAIRYPERCLSLILACAVGVCIPPPIAPDSLTAKLAVPPVGFLMWISNGLFHIDPRFASAMMTKEEIAAIRRNRDERAFLEIADTYVPLRLRVEGMRNDALHFSRLPCTVPAGIECPALIIHGDADKIVPFEHALAYRDAIPHADFFLLENGGHLAGVARRREVSERVVDFLAATVTQPATLNL